MNKSTASIFDIYINYLECWAHEIPNLIQILSLLTFSSVFLKDSDSRSDLIFLICSLFIIYIFFKNISFFRDKSPELFSRFNLDEKQWDRIFYWWTFFTFVTIVLFISLSFHLANLIPLK